MHFRQFYLDCLAHASYLIGSQGQAAIIDPQRDVDIYLEEAEIRGLSIRFIIETHMHADFVSGHLELAVRTGSRIYTSHAAEARFPHCSVRDGEELRMGAVRFRFFETPGHSLDSLCVLVFDEEEGPDPVAVLTGDTLFVGDVGRPDLMGGLIRPEELAGRLYDSLRQKLLPLPDSVKVYPAHGAGSLCGRNIGPERSSTIGQERQSNYALQPMSRDQFIGMVLAHLPESPAYFRHDQQLNRRGAISLADLPEMLALTPDEVAEYLQSGFVLLDTRSASGFAAGHIPGSLNIGLDGPYAAWAGTLIDSSQHVLLVAEDAGKVSESRLRLARVGIENVLGYLEAGVMGWMLQGKKLVHLEEVTAGVLMDRLAEPGSPLQVLDVRRAAEWESGHIASAKHIPLHDLRARAAEMDRERPVVIACASGYRSIIACSLLLQCGFQQVIHLSGGMAEWKNARYPVV